MKHWIHLKHLQPGKTLQMQQHLKQGLAACLLMLTCCRQDAGVTGPWVHLHKLEVKARILICMHAQCTQEADQTSVILDSTFPMSN
jgi:hypothetical protein